MNQPTLTASARDLGEVALKVTGLYFLLLGVTGLFGLSMSAFSDVPSVGLLGPFTVVVISLILGIGLFRWSARLSSKLFGAVASVQIPLPIEVELQAIAFRAMGILVLAGSISTMAQWLAEWIVVKAWTEPLPTVVGLATQVAFGAMLVLYRSAASARLWKQLRPLARRNGDAGAP